VTAARAADCDAESTTTVAEVGVEGGRDERLYCRLNGGSDGIAQHVGGHLSITAILRSQLRYPVRIRHRPHVEEEIRIERNPMLVSETGEMY
jgi:hypothetical protein